MPGKRTRQFKTYDDKDLRDRLIVYARIGLEAAPQQIAKILNTTRDIVYDALQRHLDNDTKKGLQ